MFKPVGLLLRCFACLAWVVSARAQERLRALNLGGPEVRTEAGVWTGLPSPPGMSTFANESVKLQPAVADEGMRRIIRSSMWTPSGRNRLEVDALPDGPCTVFLHVWEDNHAETISVFLNDAPVLVDASSGSAGQWTRLGPWPTEVRAGRLVLTGQGGHANWSAVEIWSGHLAAHPQDKPVATLESSRSDWWSLQPLAKVKVPSAPDPRRARSPVDHFLFAALKARGLGPAPEADRRTLLRRLTHDLTGLPAAPEDVEAFVADTAPDAYERRVDALLASPQFGVAWARHWMDVVRFGESQGFERNRVRGEAWRYRDWLVNALNADLPYDEFIRLQVAGDVLRPGDLDALLATGFLVCGTWDQVGHIEGSTAMQRVAREEQVEDLVGMIGQSVLGLTLHCARCHDHKFDPVPQADYFRFAALLAGVDQKEKERSGINLTAPPGAPPFAGTAHVPAFRQPEPTRLLDRGDPARPKETVRPAGLTAVQGLRPELGLAENTPEAERRRRLAQWLTDPANPLTPRVQVNRVWHNLFGIGLVETPGDFGEQGAKPSHPELLDWLATRFQSDGWRVKALVRLLVTSSAYRQRSDVPAGPAMAVDPGVQLRWRAAMRRLRAEEIRDAMLQAAGVLRLELGGPSFRDFRMDEKEKNHRFLNPLPPNDPAFQRRTLYRLWARSASTPLLAAFDCPDPSVQAQVRTSTLTPLQALSLLNGELSRSCAAAMAARLAQSNPDSPEAQCRAAVRLLFARAPSATELAEALDHVRQHGLASYCLVLFNTNEFLHLP